MFTITAVYNVDRKVAIHTPYVPILYKNIGDWRIKGQHSQKAFINVEYNYMQMDWKRIKQTSKITTLLLTHACSLVFVL